MAQSLAKIYLHIILNMINDKNGIEDICNPFRVDVPAFAGIPGWRFAASPRRDLGLWNVTPTA